jgi:hypothetical protein
MAETEVRIGGGLRLDTNGVRAIRRMSTLARYAEDAGYPLHVVCRDEGEYVDRFRTSTFVLRSRDGVIEAEELPTPVDVHSIRDFTGKMSSSRSVLLNEPEVISVGNKVNISTICADLMPVTCIQERSDTPVDLDVIPGEMVVIKPLGAQASKQVIFVPKVYASKAAKHYPNGCVIQEALHTGRVPSGIKGLTERDQERLKAARGAFELRLFAVDGELVPVAKLARGRGRTMRRSEYAPLDPDSVPDVVYKVGRKVVERVRIASGIDWIWAGIDLPYTPDREQEWALMEANLREPATPRDEKYPDTSRYLRTRMVEYLIKLAVHASEKSTNSQMSKVELE